MSWGKKIQVRQKKLGSGQKIQVGEKIRVGKKISQGKKIQVSEKKFKLGKKNSSWGKKI